MSAYNQQELIAQKLDDGIRMCVDKYTPSFTKFLDGTQLSFATQYISKYKDDVICISYGGFAGAERCVAGMFPASIYGYENVSNQELCDMFDISFIKIICSGYKKLNHRDFLGSILALGIKREAVGDIVIDSDKMCAYAAVSSTVAGLICSELSFIGNDKVKVSLISHKELPVPKREFAVISGTVASFRLDCVLSLAVNTSREKAKRLIDSKCVSINHIEETKCDVIICENDLLSVRGFGRFKIACLGGITKKGRIRIEIHKML